MLMAGRSFTEPAGLYASSLPRMTLPRRSLLGAGTGAPVRTSGVLRDHVFQRGSGASRVVAHGNPPRGHCRVAPPTPQAA